MMGWKVSQHLLPPKMKECLLKRDHFKRTNSSSKHQFSRDMLVFRGVRCYWDVWNETWFCFLKLFLAPSWLSGKWDASNRTCSLISGNTPAKFNISPLKICRAPKGKSRLASIIFQGRAAKLPGVYSTEMVMGKMKMWKKHGILTFCWFEKSVSQNLSLADRKNPGLCLMHGAFMSVLDGKFS